jgi:hypothetical protein
MVLIAKLTTLNIQDSNDAVQMLVIEFFFWKEEGL